MGLFNTIRMGASAAGDYEVERSLRFNRVDSTYIQRTASTGNTKTWTVSFWMKFCEVTGSTSQRIWTCDGNSGSYDMLKIEFDSGADSNRRLSVIDNNHAGSGIRFTGERRFRDPSAWYHIVLAVDTTQATATNRVKIYVNNEQISDWKSGSEYNHPPDQDYSTSVNASGKTNTWGRAFAFGAASADYFDGYLAEINFIDGLQLTPSSFAKTNSETGQWVPIDTSGLTFGTNGYRLKFTDNSGTTATTLGKDSCGNGNNLTPYNFSVAAGVGNDSLTDTPTNNFCTFNPLKVNPSAPIVFSEGLLQHNGVSGNNHLRSATTMQVTSGKWYVEFKFVSGYETTDSTVRFGICTDAGHRDSNNDATWYQNTDNFLAIQYGNNGTVYRSETGTNTSELTGLSTFVNGDVMGIALDLDNDKFFVSKNGTFFSNGTGTQDPANGTNPLYSGGVLTSRKSDGFYFNISGYSAQVVTADFGQHGYAYTPPTGFKAVNTANLPDPSIAKPNQHFNTVLYSGDGNSTKSITGVGFQPDLLWLKGRNTTYSHLLYNSVVGAGTGKGLNSNENRAEGTAVADNATYGYLNSFDSDGFSVTKGSDSTSYTNGGSSNYVAWNWKAGGSASSNTDGSITSSVSANTSAGFSILTYTGTGSQTTVGHGLGVKPKVIITKLRDTTTQDWMFYPKQLTGNGATYLKFNENNDVASDAHTYPDVEPTSTVYTVGGDDGGNGTNGNGSKYVAYCFSEVAGYSKFGKYTGNNNSNGTFVYLGFRPAFVIIKRLEAGYSWYMIDNKRDPINAVHENLYVNQGIATYDYTIGDFLSNGFKLRNTGSDTNKVDDHIYLAFAESPFKYSRAR